MSVRPVLIIEHESSCPPGWFGQWLHEHGCTVDVCRPYAGDAVPSSLRRHGGLVVLGGSMNVYEHGEFPWLSNVVALIGGTIATGRPFFGICLGHQLAALAMRGTVRRNPAGLTRGVTAVGWTPAGQTDPLFARSAKATPVAVHWNGDIVSSVPPHLQVLAYDSEGGVQAARFGECAWGVQFHPEAGSQLIAPWTIEKNEMVLQGTDGFDRRAAWDTVRAHDATLKHTWRPTAVAFAHVVRERGAGC